MLSLKKALYACTAIGLSFIIFSIVAIFLLETIEQKPVIIRDTVGDAVVTYQADRSQVILPYECVTFEWQLDAINATYFNDEPATGYSGEELCITPNDGVLTVIFQDETEIEYVIPITVMYSQLRFWILSIGLFLLFTSIALLAFYREETQDSKTEIWFIFGILVLIVIGFFLRFSASATLDYSFGYESTVWLRTHIEPAYNFACTYLSPICNPINPPPINLQPLLADAFHTRTGLPLTLTGLFAGFLPLNLIYTDATELMIFSSQIIHFVVDIIIALMMVGILRRLKFPDWIALMGGFIFIFFIPIIIESITILREPLSRLGFIVAIFGYVFTFQATKRFHIISYIILGTIGTLLLGFASPPNHLAMWVIFITVGFIFFFLKQHRWIAIVTQLILVLVLLISLNQYTDFVSRARGIPRQELMSLFMTGISPDGTVTALTTVTTCELVWCVEGEITEEDLQKSLTENLLVDPVKFVQLYLYSFYGNISAANNVYQQDFLLTYEQQHTQQKLFVLIGIFGIAWLLGNYKQYWKTLLLIAMPTMYFIAIFNINSIESRRLTGILQVFILAMPIYLYAMVHLLHHRRQDFWKLSATIVLTIFIWWLPLDVLAFIMPIRFATNVLFIAHIISGIGLIAYHLMIWSKQDEEFNQWLPASFLILALVIVMYGDINEDNEYEWQVPIDETIQQTISNINIDEQNWILVDLASYQEAVSLEIRVNDVVLKPAGVPMWTYIQRNILVARHVERFSYEHHHSWYAFPLYPEFLETHASSGTLEITLSSSEGVTLYGNYLLDGQNYVGPGLDPVNDISFAYISYNGDDARVTREYNVSNIMSQRLVDGVAVDDLSPSLGRQTGIYRIFVVPDDEDIQPVIIR